jgi:CBS domain-containing protein
MAVEKPDRSQYCNRGAITMRKLSYKWGIAIGLAVQSAAADAESDAARQEWLWNIGIAPMYIFVGFVIIMAIGVYFMRLRDKRRAPLSRVFETGEAIHSVGPDNSVADCVRTMTTEKIGAVIVMDGERLMGIFTERDALNKVLAGGLDPVGTKVSMVMTKDPFCIPPTTTVGAALELVTNRRVRHLPIVDSGKVLAVISSGDLIHWLVKDQVGEVQELVDLAAGS